MKEAAIGIFDSGIGGLTVASAIHKAYPQESIIYFGDTLHLPYGEKSAESIEAYAIEITEFLLSRGCKMIVIACNSASAAAYEALQAKYGWLVPIVDVISPLVELVGQQDYNKLGVIATKATVRSDIYAKKLHALKPGMEVSSLATGLLASMIEEGFVNNDISHAVLHKYLKYPDFEGIEALLLACTHYPLIRPEIENFYQGRVKVYDSVDAVVAKVGTLLREKDLLNSTGHLPFQQFFVSDYTRAFEQATRIFYEKEVHLEVAKLQNVIEK